MAMDDGSRDIEKIKKMLDRRIRDFETQIGDAVLTSIRDGSSITSAPGQPVVTGELRDSFKFVQIGTRLRVFSSLFWAPFIEEGSRTRQFRIAGQRAGLLGGLFATKRQLTLRSKRGGFHSVKLTRVNIQPLVDDIVRKVAQGG